MKIIVLGDIHGKFDSLNILINKEHPDIILQCGDNAYYWDDDKNKNVGKIKPQNTKIYLVPGNHENWNVFESEVGRHGKNPMEIEKNIFMCPVGSQLEINNHNILFIGGADSIDKEWRIYNRTWWPQEILNFNDFFYFEKEVKKADIIISHTCPYSFNVGLQFENKIIDPTRKILDLVLNKYNPKLWFFGHFHEYIEGYYTSGNSRGTQYCGLNMINETNYWKYLII
jgi:Icc-related predicted phosphoesterase